MNNQEAATRLDQFIAENRLIRGDWMRQENGKELACLLAAMVPECGEQRSASVCPAEVMPAWLAHLTPFIDDRGSLENWQAVIRKFAELVHKWHVLNASDWKSLDFQVRVICVKEAKSHTSNEQVIASCDKVIGLCERAAEGGEVSEEEWQKARTQAAAAAAAAAAADADDDAAAGAAVADDAAAAVAAVAAADADADPDVADCIIFATLAAIETRINSK